MREVTAGGADGSTNPSASGPSGAVVHVEPLGETVRTRPGEPLMRAAVRQGLRWPTICQGAALCGTCFVKVVAAEQPPPPASPKELRGLKSVPPHQQGPDTRLACQLVLTGECTVERIGVQRAAPAPSG